MSIKLNEQKLLSAVFWPENKQNLLGNLMHNQTDDNFENTKTVGASRTDKSLEIYYCVASVLSPDSKEYFVKLIFENNEDAMILNPKKSSPEIKTEKDVLDVLDSVQNSILMMNTKPEFFSTGVVKSKLKYSM